MSFAAQQVGDDIHKFGVAHVRQHHVVVVRQLVELANGESAVFRKRTVAQAGLNLHAVVRDMGRAASGNLVGTISDSRHVLLGQQILNDQKPVATELLDLCAGQSAQAVCVGAHRRSPDPPGVSAVQTQHIRA